MFFMEYVSINLESWFMPAMDNAHTHTHTHITFSPRRDRGSERQGEKGTERKRL